MARQDGDNRIEVHDRDALAAARAVLDACADAAEMGAKVKQAVARNASTPTAPRAVRLRA